MRTVSFKLPEQLDEALNDLARRRKSSRSALVREAIEALAKGKRRSVTVAVDELRSSVDGRRICRRPQAFGRYGK